MNNNQLEGKIMDSNHDIVPTLRMFDGLIMGQAADEIERLRKIASGPGFTPNINLPPIDEGEQKTILIEVKVPTDWEQRLDMQWVVEREVAADRWSWKVKHDELPPDLLADLPRTNEGETIEQKVFRLGLKAGLNTSEGNSFDDIKNLNSFKAMCKIVELAIAEEREANKEACRKVSDQGADEPGEFMRGHYAGADECFIEINKRG